MDFHDGIATGYQPAPAIPGEPAKHFGPLYDLLDASAGQRPLPVFVGATGESCRRLWPIGRPHLARRPPAARLQTRFASTAPWSGAFASESAYNCMIGFGRPR